MALSTFDNKARPPEPADLKKALGGSHGLWEQLIHHVGEHYAPVVKEWHFSGAKFGWSLRLKRRDRVVLYLTPQPGAFLVGVALGEKAATAGHSRGLPDDVLALIDHAPRYAEGRGIRVSVTSRRDLLAVQQLAALKMAP